MSRRISLLVAATTSAVILAFLIPLGLLVRNMAADRASADADAEARNVAILVSSLHEASGLDDAVAAIDARSEATTTVVLAEGRHFGSGEVTAASADVRRARKGSAFTRTTARGHRIVIPVLTSNGTDVVVTDVSNAQLRAGVARAWLLLGLLGGLMLVAALAVAEQIGRRISTPVPRVAEVADQLREGDLTARAGVEGPAETKALAIALNRLGERITELLAAERAAVGDLSHRLRTPVTSLRIDVDSVPDEALAERMRHHVANLQRTIDAIVKDARRPVLHEMRSSCDPVAVVAERVGFWSALAEDQGRVLTPQLAQVSVTVGLDAADLADVIDIVIDNVFAHTLEGTDFAVSVSTTGEVVLIVVHDLGSEPPERIEEGRSGLGLQIARRTVSAAGGILEFHQDPSTGTTVTISLPLQSS